MQKGQVQVQEISHLHQHPLAVESTVHPSQLLTAVDAQQTQKKSPNSRRRRRGSRRRSSAVADMAPEEDGEEEEKEEQDMSSNAQPSAESDPFFMTVHHGHHKHRRRSSHTGSKARPKHKTLGATTKDEAAASKRPHRQKEWLGIKDDQ
ncbi:hypothetical protein G6F42_023830 [Rhizopus arrhizus]|nr:hypothetical protein G6F42_023830 [Rhizopus arrhizus]